MVAVSMPAASILMAVVCLSTGGVTVFAASVGQVVARGGGVDAEPLRDRVGGHRPVAALGGGDRGRGGRWQVFLPGHFSLDQCKNSGVGSPEAPDAMRSVFGDMTEHCPLSHGHTGTAASHEYITDLKWIDESDSKTGTNSKASLVEWIDGGGHAYVGPLNGKVTVGVVKPAGLRPYLRTYADQTWNNNLLALPRF